MLSKKRCCCGVIHEVRVIASWAAITNYPTVTYDIEGAHVVVYDSGGTLLWDDYTDVSGMVYAVIPSALTGARIVIDVDRCATKDTGYTRTLSAGGRTTFGLSDTSGALSVNPTSSYGMMRQCPYPVSRTLYLTDSVNPMSTVTLTWTTAGQWRGAGSVSGVDMDYYWLNTPFASSWNFFVGWCSVSSATAFPKAGACTHMAYFGDFPCVQPTFGTPSGSCWTPAGGVFSRTQAVTGGITCGIYSAVGGTGVTTPSFTITE